MFPTISCIPKTQLIASLVPFLISRYLLIYTYIHMNMYIYIPYVSCICLGAFSFPSFWGLIRFRAVLIMIDDFSPNLVKACQLPIWLESSFIIIHFVGCLTNNTKPQDNKIYIFIYIYTPIYIYKYMHISI